MVIVFGQLQLRAKHCLAAGCTQTIKGTPAGSLPGLN
jgi:hypothetical protein